MPDRTCRCEKRESTKDGRTKKPSVEEASRKNASLKKLYNSRTVVFCGN